MDIEKINVDSIKDLESAKQILKQVIDCIFIMNRNIQRQLNHLTSQNVVSLDFNITQVKNIDKVLDDYATKNYVESNYQPLSTE